MPGPKKAQRTKGNLKPSSSSQAVQLLAQSGHSPVGFIGFSNQPAYVPASEIFDDVDTTLDADFRLVLRKFSKKDTVTKIKALQEFSSLCGSKGDDCIKAIVPFWPRIYNKVAIDVDHKVRELSQKALQALAEKAGKNLSPHLRSIMGAWMVSMCDTYPTVASAANASFNAVFPPAKQTAAVRFCKAECAEYFLSNITKQTPQTLSDPLTTSEEDMKGKYQRVVCSSLHAMRKLIDVMVSDAADLDFMATYLNDLLSSPAFWKHAKSTVSIVNGGILSILSSICQHCPLISGSFISKICPLVLSFIDLKDPVIASYSWEAVLSLVNAHSDCWQHVNWQKAVWPKLKSVLENGCSGQAEVIAPCLLPLLSKLPQKNFSQYFDSFRLGLNQENVINSPSAMSALIKAFVECIHYCVKNTDISEQTVIQGLVQDQILVVVEASLTDLKPALARSPLYVLLSSLVAYLGNNHPKVEKEFWNELSTFTRHRFLLELNSRDTEPDAENPESDVSPTKTPSIKSFFHRLALLVKGLIFQDSPRMEIKKEKVKFVQEDISNKPSAPTKNDKKYLSTNLENFVSDILVTSFSLATKFHALEYFQLFKDTATLHIPTDAAKRLNYAEDHLILELCEELQTRLTDVSQDEDVDIDKKLQQLYEMNQSDTSNEFIRFLYLSLLKLILYEQKKDAKSNLVFTEELIISAFAFLHCLSEDDAVKFLTVVSETLSSLPLMCQFIEHMIRNVKTIPACGKAMQMSIINNKIAELASGVTSAEKLNSNEEAEGIWRMMLSFVLHVGEGPMVSNSCVDTITNSCVLTLDHCRRKKIVLTLQSFSGLMSVVHTLLDKNLVKGHSKFSELMSNLLLVALDSTIVNAESLTKMETVLRTGFDLIVSDLPEQNTHLLEVCRSIRKWLRSNLKSSKDLDAVVKTIETLVSVMSDSEKDTAEEDGSSQTTSSGINESLHTVTGSNKNILDNLLDTDTIQVDELTEVTHELYIKGSLSSVTGKNVKIPKPAVMELESFALLKLYNFRTFKLINGMHASQTDVQKCLLQNLSERQLCSLTQLAEFLFVIDAGNKNNHPFVKEVAHIVNELEREMMKCMSCMTQTQVQALMEAAIKRSDSSSISASRGLENVFDDLLHSGLDLHSRRSIKDALQSLQTRFIDRCVSGKEEACVILSRLKDKAVWSGKDVTQAYTSVCSFLMDSEDLELTKITECLAGFIRLWSKCEEVTSEDRMMFFNQTSNLMKTLKAKGIHLLTGSDSEDSNNTDLLQYNTCVARALTTVPVCQQEEYWEFTLCTLIEWIQFLSEMDITRHSSLELQALTASVYHLAHSVALTLSTAQVIEEIESDSPPAAVAVHQKTKSEWEEFFSEGIFSPMLTKFVCLATESQKTSSPSSWTIVLDFLASAVTLCPLNFLMSHELPAKLTVTDSSYIPDNLKTLLNHLCPLLNAGLWKVQIAACNLLGIVMEEVSDHEEKTTEGNKDNSQEEEARSPPEALSLVVEANAVSLDSVLMMQDIEEKANMDIGSPEHSVAVGYLLAWSLQLQLFRCASNELRAKYAQFFKTHDSVSHLCDHLFRLMPSPPSTSVLEFQLALNGTDEMNSSLLGSLAISVYRQCLEVLPALVRTWWVDQNRKSSNFVDRFTTQYISNGLCVRQLTSSEMTSASIEDITIRPRPAAREVSAVYEMAEVTVNMTIRLPENYPLGKVDVSCDKRVGVSQAQWDKWLLQLNIFLQHQNGSIVEGLKLWKGNIDKKFEGIDDCMICFSVIHGTTFQLPRLSCRTCRKKFHSSCLYKWFSTSQKSSCPLCRNLF